MNPFEDIARQSKSWDLIEDGIDVSYEEGFIEEEQATRLFEDLKREIAWERHVISTPGGPKTVPRMISWYADEGLEYRYSGIVHVGRAWTPALLEVRRLLEDRLKEQFNGVLANFYEHEKDSVSPHSDDEKELVFGAPIASISFGETRNFVLKHNHTGARHILPLQHGSLLIMRGMTQEVAKHSLPKSQTKCGPRINLTFRKMRT